MSIFRVHSILLVPRWGQQVCICQTPRCNIQEHLSCFWSSLFWDVMRRRLVVIYERFGTTYRSHLQGSSSKNPLSPTVNYVVLCSKLDIRVVRRTRHESRGRKHLEDSMRLSSEPSIQEDSSLSQCSMSFYAVLSNIDGRKKKQKHSFLTSTRLFGSSD